MFFIDVIVPLSLPRTFTYSVSEAEFHYVEIGMRVAVPVKNKMYTSIVVSLHQTPPTLYEAREIHEILDDKPIVNSFQIEHWKWVASYYMCTLGEVYRTAMPSAFILESETIISQKKDIVVDEKSLTDDEFLIFEALQHQSSLKVQDVMAILNKKNVFPIIQKLLAKNVLSLQEELQEEYKPKLLRYIRLHETFSSDESLMNLLDSLKGAKQKETILAYFQLKAQEQKPISVKQVLAQAQVSTAVIKALIDKDIFEEYYIQEDRVTFHKNKKAIELMLSEIQQEAYDEIETLFKTKDVTLLHGVTASGKTEIYIKLIESFIATGKQVLYLLPEIALTTQLVSRLTAYFGNQVAVFHSKFSNNERVEVWHQVLEKSDKAKIVIGARSALFLPFSNLGLILIDEEHEQTFKQQDPAPRYHARDAAIVLAKAHKAKVVLGSATPSLETYFNAETKKYGLVTLAERFGKTPLPEVILVDLKENYFKKRMKGHFSQTLIENITEALNLREQVILFQNRRGFSPILECITCGHIPQCTSCNVSLTYHKFKNQLRCHYCGYAIAKPTHCHACSSVDIYTKGFGTEQIELELAALFPTKNIKRMDQDTTRGKFSFEKLIDSFKNREIDILVGTQMLAKGLDFDNVSLVGIMNADNMLYHPDFRAFERSFQMMTQVAGRAGRADKRGKVIIQTYSVNHNIIQQVTHNDFLGMYKEQLYERRIFQYPPFFRLIKITLKHQDYEKLKSGAMWMYQVMQQQLQIPVLGPEEPGINRIRNEYIRTIMIKIPQEVSIQTTKNTIQKIRNSFESISNYRAIKVVVNVDFY
ncbi:replication restart helicase PriA [Flavobacterium aciduliphilum]|uniref:Replication restart protein PriA n=1 Tax=Flavobacterium aciduliphilum TaxID=1101402 RepID=A0A328YNM4_9FLAO|nr:primosomal protein N' [Flavobacterium aciduliphilum]RAR75459.1 replication restart DNA helicase PriA [Flavobacterium aciduliphilum]